MTSWNLNIARKKMRRKLVNRPQKKNKLAQKINTLIDQNKTLKKLRFRTEDDNQAREVARIRIRTEKNF